MLPGKHLYLVGTGTGLAPFLSIVKDHEIYEQFDKIILIHGVRYISELAYRDTIQEQLPKHEYLGDLISQKLIYYPLVTREPLYIQWSSHRGYDLRQVIFRYKNASAQSPR